MRPPPKFYPRDLSLQFAADPFDAKHHESGPGRLHTPLGLLIEIWYWYQVHRDECGPAFQPIANEVRLCLKRLCPEKLKELENSGLSEQLLP